MTISASIEDFQDVIKALPQTTEIDLPGRPKRFIALGIAIAAAALSSYNAYRITELNNEISALKSKTDLLVDVSHLHEAHLHHLEDKTDATNKLLADLLESNVWFTAKITDAVEKKFQSVVHENVVKSAQHHRLAPGALPHDVLDKILNHTVAVAKKRNMVSFVNYASDLFQVEVSHLYDPKTMQFTLIVHIPWSRMPTCWSFTNFCHCRSTSTSRQTSQSPLTSARATFWPLDTQNLFKLSPALICIHASTSETPSFAREGK